MIKSMTGYGRSEVITDKSRIIVELKSVNNRYLDTNIKMPRYCLALEEKVRNLVSKVISRGKIDVNIIIEKYDDDTKAFELNSSIAKSYIDALLKLKDDFGLKDDISVATVARNNDIFYSKRKEEDLNDIWKMIEPVILSSCTDFISMRAREGERLYSDFLLRIDIVSDIVVKIEKRFPEVISEYRARLKNKLDEVLEGKDIDDSRILTEVAIFSDKIAIDEEMVRLKSHLIEFMDIIRQDEPVGRKLDFLMQEINREANTTGSKVTDYEVSKLVIELKSELEKLREQIQNIE